MRSRTHSRRALASGAFALVASVASLASHADAQVRVDTIASERESRIAPQGLAEGATPGLADDGTVAFWGSTANSPNSIFVGDGTAVWPIDVGASGLSRPRSIKLNGDALVFVADAPSARGVYAVDRAGGPIAPVHVIGGPGKLPAINDVALSTNGTLAFATVCSDCGRGGGAVLTGTRFGALTELQRGTAGGGAFLYNSQYVDINDRGQVAVQAEYLPEYKRAIFVLQRAGDPIANVDTAVDGLGSGSQPRPALNNRGEVAYVLDRTQVIIATPSRFGTPKAARIIADASGPYASFGRVDLDDRGNVVFEATLDDGRKGIFSGPDAAAHKVALEGEPVGGLPIVTLHAMGQLNNQSQLALVAAVQAATDTRVLRITGLPATPR
ncbi:MAG: hypothetical protein ABW252_14780 [Polyangiales bacterium]